MPHNCLSFAAFAAGCILGMPEGAVAKNAIDLNEYARRLYARKHEAFDIEDRLVRGFDGWEPKPQFCHGNVARFVAENPEYTAVHGWYVSDRADHFAFLAHSIVQDSNGVYINITNPPNSVHWKYQFLEDDDPDYWVIADGASRGTIGCFAEGRSQKEIDARLREMDAENAAAFRDPSIRRRLLNL